MQPATGSSYAAATGWDACIGLGLGPPEGAAVAALFTAAKFTAAKPKR